MGLSQPLPQPWVPEEGNWGFGQSQAAPWECFGSSSSLWGPQSLLNSHYFTSKPLNTLNNNIKHGELGMKGTEGTQSDRGWQVRGQQPWVGTLWGQGDTGKPQAGLGGSCTWWGGGVCTREGLEHEGTVAPGHGPPQGPAGAGGTRAPPADLRGHPLPTHNGVGMGGAAHGTPHPCPQAPRGAQGTL